MQSGTQLSTFHFLASLVAQLVKNLPAVKEMRAQFDSWVSKIPWRRKWQQTSILDWRIPGTQEPGRLQSTGSQELDTT